MVINNVTVKDPSVQGVTVTDEPIWSSNTGRNTQGKMIGDVVAFKTTIAVTWALLTYQEAYTIKNAVITGMQSNNGFFSITYPETNSSGQLTTATKTVYAGNIPRKLYSTNANARYYQDVTITFIEQ